MSSDTEGMIPEDLERVLSEWTPGTEDATAPKESLVLLNNLEIKINITLILKLCTVFTLYSAVCSVNCTLYNVHYTLYPYSITIQ